MKPAQKLKGARLEAGQTQERDDASLLAHREESKDAVKSRRAFLRFVLVTVYLVVWGVSVLAFWMGGRTDAMGYSLVVFYAVLPLSTLVLSFFIGCGRAWDGCKRTMLFFFGAMSMLGPYVTFSLSNMASFQKFNLPELSAFLPGLLCAVAGMAGLASHSMAAPGRWVRQCGLPKGNGQSGRAAVPALSGHEKTAAPTGAAAPCFVVFSMQLAFLEAFGVYTPL